MLNHLVLQAFTAVQVRVARARNESGQTLAEYSLLITIIAVGVVVLAMIAFRGALAGAYNAATGCLDGSC